MKILLDENINPQLAELLPYKSHVTSALSVARGVKDKHWLQWAEENGLSVFVTGDTKLPHEQNLSSFGIAVVWFKGPPNTLEGVRPYMEEVNALLPQAVRGNATICVQEEGAVIEEVQQN
jgi:hypothetical protein